MGSENHKLEQSNIGFVPLWHQAGGGGGGNARAPGFRELDRKVARPGGSPQDQHLVALLDVTKRGALQGLLSQYTNVATGILILWSFSYEALFLLCLYASVHSYKHIETYKI